jgi:hypothetical protein
VSPYQAQERSFASLLYRAGRRDLLWVSNIQADQIATQADVIRTRSNAPTASASTSPWAAGSRRHPGKPHIEAPGGWKDAPCA